MTLGVADHLARWDAVHEARAWGRYPPEELVRFVGRRYFQCADRQSLRFLEMGCGQGANLWFLLREGFGVAGIDGSPAAIRKCGDRLRAEGLPTEPPACELRAGDFSLLPWSDQSFDVVIDIESIYANPLRTIIASVAEASRVLKPGGIMFAKMFGSETTGAGSGELLEPGTTFDPAIGPLAGHGVAHFFTASEIRDLFEAFASVQVGWARRGSDAGTEVFEWIVEACK
jgi:SAM-dependent methyltransferase